MSASCRDHRLAADAVIVELVAECLRTLGAAAPLQQTVVLARGEAAPQGLAEEIWLPRPPASKRLLVLVRAGLAARRSGAR